MLRNIWLLFFCLSAGEGYGQYSWKVEKDKDGIKIYSSEIANASFKAVKVECTFPGTFQKLASILTNVTQYPDWVYNTKKTQILRQNDFSDIVYYTETSFPWPFSNRDAVIHLQVRTDTVSKVMMIAGSNESSLVPEFFGKVRIPHYSANWVVTSPSPGTIKINYTIEADPGGNIPSWLANMFIDKGPYETFKKLGEKLTN